MASSFAGSRNEIPFVQSKGGPEHQARGKNPGGTGVSTPPFRRPFDTLSTPSGLAFDTHSTRPMLAFDIVSRVPDHVIGRQNPVRTPRF